MSNEHISVVGDSLYLKPSIDGRKVQYCMSEGDVRRNITKLKDNQIIDEIKSQMTRLDQEQLQRVGEHLLSDYTEPMAICPKHDHLIPASQWGCPNGSYVYNMCKQGTKECPECGKTETLEVSSTSNSTRSPTTYRCSECGELVRGITTG